MRALTLLFAIGLLVVSCTDDPSAKYFPDAPPHASPSASADVQNVPAALVESRTLHGAVSRPDPKLTPGVVADADLTSVCRGPKRLSGQFKPAGSLVSPADQQAILAEYRIPAANIKHYGFDFLVPLQLGGARVAANIWPVSTHGVGFREKEVLNVRLHVLVCRRELSLDQAQKMVAADWVKLWIFYG